jgi:hypothetical protein
MTRSGADMINHREFRVEPWAVTETSLNLDVLAQSESIFALSNGHIGLRGNLDEGEPHGLRGTYLNSVYEERPLPYAEPGYGSARNAEPGRLPLPGSAPAGRHPAPPRHLPASQRPATGGHRFQLAEQVTLSLPDSTRSPRLSPRQPAGRAPARGVFKGHI